LIFSHGIKCGYGEPGKTGILSEIVSVRSKILITKNPRSLKYHFANF